MTICVVISTHRYSGMVIVVLFLYHYEYKFIIIHDVDCHVSCNDTLLDNPNITTPFNNTE